MRRRITMLVMAVLLALTMSLGGAGAAFAAQCGTGGGPGCLGPTDNPDKNNPKFVTFERGAGGGSGSDKQDCSVNPSGNTCR